MFDTVMVDGESMMPTLRNMERIVIMKTFNKQPKRGDIIATKYPQRTGYFVKRVIALPGETIEIKNGIAYVNGEKDTNGNGLSAPDYGLAVVPPGHIFVLGDNRANSVDSHNLPDGGFIPMDYILGRALKN